MSVMRMHDSHACPSQPLPRADGFQCKLRSFLTDTPKARKSQVKFSLRSHTLRASGPQIKTQIIYAAMSDAAQDSDWVSASASLSQRLPAPKTKIRENAEILLAQPAFIFTMKKTDWLENH